MSMRGILASHAVHDGFLIHAAVCSRTATAIKEATTRQATDEAFLIAVSAILDADKKLRTALMQYGRTLDNIRHGPLDSWDVFSKSAAHLQR